MANENKAPSLTASVQIGRGFAFVGDLFTANSMAALGMIQGRISFGHDETFSELTLSDQTGPEVLDRLSLGHNIRVTIPVVMDALSTLLPKIASSGNRGFGYSSPQKPVETGLAIISLSDLGGGLKNVQNAWSRLAGNGIAAAPSFNAVVSAAGAAQGATTIPVAALGQAMPSGTVLIFLPGALKTATLTAPASLGATSLTVAAIPTALVSADTAPFSGTDAVPKNSLFLWRAGLSAGELSFGVEDGGRMIVPVTGQAMHSFNAGVPEGMKLGYYGDPMTFTTPVVGFNFSSSTA